MGEKKKRQRFSNHKPKVNGNELAIVKRKMLKTHAWNKSQSTENGRET